MTRPVAFVTGATSGIGAAFAAHYAAAGHDLVVTGRREAAIHAVADALEAAHGVSVRVILAELGDRARLEAVAAAVADVGDALAVLVNNAGFARRGPFHEVAFEHHARMLDVHGLATMRLAHAALPSMVARGAGAIINVSSVAALTPLPGNANYAATKALINTFSEALQLDLTGTGVRVLALCPGLTRTELHRRIGLDTDAVYRRRGLLMHTMTPEAVVEAAVRGLRRGQVLCVPGAGNKLLTTLPRLLPRRATYRLARYAGRRAKDMGFDGAGEDG